MFYQVATWFVLSWMQCNTAGILVIGIGDNTPSPISCCENRVCEVNPMKQSYFEPYFHGSGAKVEAHTLDPQHRQPVCRIY